MNHAHVLECLLNILIVFIDIQFNNSVKELVFACDWNRLQEPGTLPGLGNNLTKVSLTINGNNIFQSDRSLNYFTRNLIYERHEGNPNTFLSSMKGEGSIFHKEDSSVNTLGQGGKEHKFANNKETDLTTLVFFLLKICI